MSFGTVKASTIQNYNSLVDPVKVSMNIPFSIYLIQCLQHIQSDLIGLFAFNIVLIEKMNLACGYENL